MESENAPNFANTISLVRDKQIDLQLFAKNTTSSAVLGEEVAILLLVSIVCYDYDDVVHITDCLGSLLLAIVIDETPSFSSCIERVRNRHVTHGLMACNIVKCN